MSFRQSARVCVRSRHSWCWCYDLMRSRHEAAWICLQRCSVTRDVEALKHSAGLLHVSSSHKHTQRFNQQMSISWCTYLFFMHIYFSLLSPPAWVCWFYPPPVPVLVLSLTEAALLCSVSLSCWVQSVWGFVYFLCSIMSSISIHQHSHIL